MFNLTVLHMEIPELFSELLADSAIIKKLKNSKFYQATKKPSGSVN